MQKNKLSLEEYRRKKEGNVSNITKPPIDPRLKSIGKQKSSEPLSLKCVKWAVRIKGPHLKNDPQTSLVVKRRHTQPEKSPIAPIEYDSHSLPSHVQPQKSSGKQPSVLSPQYSSNYFPQEESYNSLTEPCYFTSITSGGKLTSNSLKRRRVSVEETHRQENNLDSNHSQTVSFSPPIPNKRSRESIESLDGKEPCVSVSAKSKFNSTDFKSPHFEFNCASKSEGLNLQTKSSKQISEEPIYTDYIKHNSKDSVEKTEFSSIKSDKPDLAKKNITSPLSNSVGNPTIKVFKPAFSDNLSVIEKNYEPLILASADKTSTKMSKTDPFSLKKDNFISSGSMKDDIFNSSSRSIRDERFNSSSESLKDDRVNTSSRSLKDDITNSTARSNKKLKRECSFKPLQTASNQNNIVSKINDVMRDGKISLKPSRNNDKIARLDGKTVKSRSVESKTLQSEELESNNQNSIMKVSSSEIETCKSNEAVQRCDKTCSTSSKTASKSCFDTLNKFSGSSKENMESSIKNKFLSQESVKKETNVLKSKSFTLTKNSKLHRKNSKFHSLSKKDFKPKRKKISTKKSLLKNSKATLILQGEKPICTNSKKLNSKDSMEKNEFSSVKSDDNCKPKSVIDPTVKVTENIDSTIVEGHEHDTFKSDNLLEYSNCENFKIPEKQISLVPVSAFVNNDHRLEKSILSMSSIPLFELNEETCDSEFPLPKIVKVESLQVLKKCNQERQINYNCKKISFSYRKYENGKMAILMLDHKKQTCKKLSLNYVFSTKGILSAGVPLEIFKTFLYAPPVLYAFSIECCFGFILSEVFRCQTLTVNVCSKKEGKCMLLSILKHLKNHCTQCEVFDLLCKFTKGFDKEHKLKIFWSRLQELKKNLICALETSGHKSGHNRSFKSSCQKLSIFLPHSFKCSTRPNVDIFLNSYESIKNSKDVGVFLHSDKIFCCSYHMDWEQFSMKLCTGISSGAFSVNTSVGLCDPCICLRRLSYSETIAKDSFHVSLIRKGISFSVLKSLGNSIDLNLQSFFEKRFFKGLSCYESLESIPISLFHKVFLTNDPFSSKSLTKLYDTFSYMHELQSTCLLVRTRTSYYNSRNDILFMDSNGKDTVLVCAINNDNPLKCLSVISFLKHTSMDLFNSIYESAFKLTTAPKGIMTLFPPASTLNKNESEVLNMSVDNSAPTHCIPESSSKSYPAESIETVNGSNQPKVFNNLAADSSNANLSFKSPCIGHLILNYKHDLKSEFDEDKYERMFVPYNLFEEGTVLGNYYKHLSRTGSHKFDFSTINLNNISDEKVFSFKFLLDQLNYHKSVLQGLIFIASEPGKKTTQDEIERITEQLEIIEGFKVACRAILL